MITHIDLNPKDIEQKGDMNSNCDWDCDQVIGFGEILTELLKLDLLDGPTGRINEIESIAINLPSRTCLFYTQKPDDDEDTNATCTTMLLC